ncbi:hypothetical protein MH138_17875 [Bacillus safensis]|uniref:hypothetical protein n=1 Tax=Bacillus TaxID=1386 RepID=UPI00065D35F2|nr:MULTISPECIES: hypothetical protein [Bacillus]MBW4850541.1 hypothetical protein [Bacillaceae bacterium]KMK71767.1 hypothetical protein ACJ64_04245 [Bacillus safensis]MBU5206517.1 hypothetical protein [Bacillus safensis]MBW4852905.1 hypothetical protein [Bacillaceae bacterium]MBW4855055.1 hypothetical protein [Bacillaceae bacterium]
MKRLIFLMLALVLAVTAFAPAASAKTQSTKGLEGLTEEQIETSLKEIEYIFTKIIISEKEKGFVINEEELAKSPYSDEVKDGMVAFAKLMNQEIVTQSNTVTRCIEDAAGIARGTLKNVQKSIDRGDWLAVAGAIGLAGAAVHPTVVFIFMLTCGAPVAKIAPAHE